MTGSDREILERTLSGSGKEQKQQSNGSINTAVVNSSGHNGQDSSPAETENDSKDGNNDKHFVDQGSMSFDQLEQLAKYIGKKLSVKQGMCFAYI